MLTSYVVFKTPYVYTGTSGDDVLTSRYTTAVNETFYGYDGNDFIDGGLGSDRMVGGKGHDIYVVDNSSDAVVENAGEDSTRSACLFPTPSR